MAVRTLVTAAASPPPTTSTIMPFLFSSTLPALLPLPGMLNGDGDVAPPPLPTVKAYGVAAVGRLVRPPVLTVRAATRWATGGSNVPVLVTVTGELAIDPVPRNGPALTFVEPL